MELGGIEGQARELMGGAAGTATARGPASGEVEGAPPGCRLTGTALRRLWGFVGKVAWHVLVAVDGEGDLRARVVDATWHAAVDLRLRCRPRHAWRDWTVVNASEVFTSLRSFGAQPARTWLADGHLWASCGATEVQWGGQVGGQTLSEAVEPGRAVALAVLSQPRAQALGKAVKGGAGGEARLCVGEAGVRLERASGGVRLTSTYPAERAWARPGDWCGRYKQLWLANALVTTDEELCLSLHEAPPDGDGPLLMVTRGGRGAPYTLRVLLSHGEAERDGGARPSPGDLSARDQRHLERLGAGERGRGST